MWRDGTTGRRRGPARAGGVAARARQAARHGGGDVPDPRTLVVDRFRRPGGTTRTTSLQRFLPSHQSTWPATPATWQQTNLGASFARLAQATESESIEKRFVALLNCRRDDLHAHLRHAVGLLKSKDIPVDWAQLAGGHPGVELGAPQRAARLGESVLGGGKKEGRGNGPSGRTQQSTAQA